MINLSLELVFPMWGFNASNRRNELQLQHLRDLGPQIPLSQLWQFAAFACFLSMDGFSAAAQNIYFGYFSVSDQIISQENIQP